jgi:glycosyltransferase involved in cell wall biosynthesis
MEDLTLVIPAKNESECLPQVLTELKKFNYKTTVSLREEDLKTISSIKNFKIDIYFQTENGYGNALTECIQKVKTKYFCIFNADGSFDPQEISIMYNNLKNKNLNFLFASRYLKNASSEDDTFLTYIGNQIFSFLGKIFFKLSITDILYTYVLGETKAFNELKIKSKDFSFCVEFPIKAQRFKFKLGDCKSNERKRIAGKKKVNEFFDGFKILLKMFKLYIVYKKKI